VGQDCILGKCAFLFQGITSRGMHNVVRANPARATCLHVRSQFAVHDLRCYTEWKVGELWDCETTMQLA
jgi:hypothetical protein